MLRMMKLSGFVGICLFGAILAASQAGDWKEYVYEGDGFAISAPSEPVLQKQMMKPVAGEVEVHFYFIAAEGYQMVVIYGPLHPNDKRTAQQALEDSKKGVGPFRGETGVRESHYAGKISRH